MRILKTTDVTIFDFFMIHSLSNKCFKLENKCRSRFWWIVIEQSWKEKFHSVSVAAAFSGL